MYKSEVSMARRRRSSCGPITLASLLGLVLLLSQQSASAYSFRLNDAEYAAWPRLCQAVYLSVDVGKRSKYVSMIPAKEVNQARRYSDRRKAGIWHYCAGEVYLKRAARARSAQKRTFALKAAISEANFSHTRLQPREPVREHSGIVIARAHLKLGNHKEAEQYAVEVITNFPRSERGYSLLYFVYLEQGRTKDAVATLLLGNKALDGKSAQLNYFLGLAAVDANQLDEAEKYAEQAYALGYPLPGLRDKLAAARSKAPEATPETATKQATDDTQVATGQESTQEPDQTKAKPDDGAKPELSEPDPRKAAKDDSEQGSGTQSAPKPAQ